ncbi:hypothetical protein V6N13_133093 [Hibiscus sabdariffa]|uniref:Uncharacterized protein n=1 Tax=Hibiscus sabdariffa TaxID=183260 RepID=A0ABR2PXX8_9ROSI
MDEDKWPIDVSVNQHEVGSTMQLHAPAVTTWGMITIDTNWRAGRETMTTNREAIQENLIFNLGGPGQGARNVSWGTGQRTFRDNGNINLGTYWGRQQEGLDYQGKDSSFNRGGSSMHRHSTYK